MFSFIKKVIDRIGDTNTTHHAAAVTYYTMMSLFPALLFGVSVLSLVGGTGLVKDTTDWLLESGADRSMVESVATALESIVNAQSSTVSIGFAVGLILAINAASGAFGAVGLALTIIRGDDDQRSFIIKRRDQIVGMLVMMALVLCAMVSVFVGGPLAETVFGWIGFGDTAVSVWNIARYPLALAIASTAIGWIYSRSGLHRPWRLWSPGTVFAALGWIVVSVGFFFYVANFGKYNATYGAFATAVVLLLWIYLSWLVVLVGGIIDNILAPEPLEDLSMTVPDAPAEDLEPAGARKPGSEGPMPSSDSDDWTGKTTEQSSQPDRIRDLSRSTSSDVDTKTSAHDDHVQPKPPLTLVIVATVLAIGVYVKARLSRQK